MRLLMGCLLALQVVAFQGAAPHMKECGLAVDKDHPCHCLMHTSQVQNDYMDSCLKVQFDKAPRQARTKALAECAAQMPQHCNIVDKYGDWATDENGNHISPMPNQCTMACTRSHCRCDDGPTCHFGHTLDDDRPAKKRK